MAAPEIARELTWEGAALAIAKPASWDPVRARVALSAAIASVLAGGAPEGRLGRLIEARGLIDALEQVGADLAAAGVGAAQVAERVHGRARDLCAVLVDAEARSGQPAAVDPVRAAALALAAGAPLEARTVAVMAEGRWDAARVALVEALARRVPVSVELPGDPARPALALAAEAAFAAFERLGESVPGLEVRARDPAETAGAAGELLLRTFQPRTEAATPAAIRDGAVTVGGAAAAATEARPHAVEVVAAAGPAAAAGEAARLARAAVDAGVAPEDVVIGAVDAAALELAARALERVALPVDRQPGRPSEAPPVRLALGLGEITDQGLGTEAVLELVTSRYVAAPEGVSSRELAQIARQAGVRRLGARGDAAARLAEHAARIAARGTEPALAEAARVRAAAVHLARVAEALEALPARATVAAHARALAEAVRVLGLATESGRGAARAADPALESLVAHEEAALARDQQAYLAFAAALRDAEREGARVAGGVELGRRAFRALLADLTELRAPSRTAVRGARVALVPLRRVAGRDARVVILLGVEDGRLPAAPPDSPLYDEADRAGLDRVLREATGRGFRLPGSAEPLALARAEDALALYRAIAAAREQVHVIYALADEGEPDALRSPFIDELTRAGAPSRVAPRSHVPEPVDVASPGALLARVAEDTMAERRGMLRPPTPRPRGQTLAMYRQAQAMLGERLAQVAAVATVERERLWFFEGRREAGPFEGAVGAEPALVALGVEPRRALSVTQLESYAACPFRMLASRVLGVREAELPAEELDAKSRGSIVHECLHQVYQRLHEAGALPVPPLDADGKLAPPVVAAMTAACEEVLAGTKRARFVGHHELWEIQKARIRSAVERLLTVEAESAFSKARPSAFEVAFGHDEAWPALRVPAPDGAGEVWFQGKIDRVDIGPNQLAVIDYKTGRKERYANLMREEERLHSSFQLPIYAAAARAALGDRAQGASVDALYVSVKDAAASKSLRERAGAEGVRVDDILALDGEALAGARERGTRALGDAVWELVGRMRAGQFEVRPNDCEYCPIETACRVVHLERDEDDLK